jgi:hypothetical protein
MQSAKRTRKATSVGKWSCTFRLRVCRFTRPMLSIKKAEAVREITFRRFFHEHNLVTE